MTDYNYISANEENRKFNKVLFPTKADYTVNLRKVNVDSEKVILLMGLNPAGDEEHKDCDPFIDYIPIFEEDFKLSQNAIKDMTYNKYFKPNYELFESINAKMYWLNDFENIMKVREKLDSNDRHTFDTIVENEKSKNGPMLIFSDLFHVRNKNAKNVKNDLELIKDNNQLIAQISCIIENQISYYKPNMIVVTNAYASEIIQKYYFRNEAFVDAMVHNEIVYIFSGMISGQRALDRFSRIRLEKAIKESWNLINHNLNPKC
ncbi:MAG: hypothetical protein CVV56_02095 [Tenericutes bacterium HGW-Tenericutes-1]|jgi:hypothetical protein|nr:MAG: hypothetical protein CVV56_02095 [Tenericutes bacterium HGW-Tenericutes-1]